METLHFEARAALLAAVIVLAVLAAPAGSLAAQAPAADSAAPTAYELGWHTVDGGGGVSQSDDGRFVLVGTAGQADTGVIAGSPYTLVGGFWAREAPAPPPARYHVYLPLVVRGES